MTSPAMAAPEAHVDPEAASAANTLHRWIGDTANKFDLELTDAGGADKYTVSAEGGQVTISATTPATLLAGFNAYVSDVVGQSVSWNSSNLNLPATLPDTETISATANVDHRFVNNDVEDGYTGPYRTLAQWKKLIDIYAMHGLNEVFIPIGSDAVYFDAFTELGYDADDILAWIPQAEHQPWWLLQNMSSQEEPLTKQQVDDDAALGRAIADYARSLGMTPVLPGYFGTVPDNFSQLFPDANLVPQGKWAGGYDRPDWLDPTSAPFPEVAAAFYTASKNRLGATSMYKADLLHEGGQAGNVNVANASAAVQDAMQQAVPNSIWVLLGWQANPPAQVIAGADTSHMLIVDGLSDRYSSSNRESDWAGTPYAFGSIWNFGGHTTMGANLGVQNDRYFELLGRANSALDGIAVLPEAGENNPAAFDFLTSLPWRSQKVNMDDWFADWAQRRYGTADPHAAQAWQIIGRTAYAMPADGWSEAADSIFGAEPSLTVGTAAAWSPSSQRYDTEEFAKALPLLLDVSDAVTKTDTYRYDLMAVSRQVLANLDRPLLALIKEAYEHGRVGDFDELTQRWLADMDLIDELAGTNEQQLLGSWIDSARARAGSEAQADAQERGARSIISTWTPPEWGTTDLGDYANRLWNGLTGGYYKARWSAFFEYLDSQLAGSDATKPDFAAMGAEFVAGTGEFEPAGGYLDHESGAVMDLAQQVGAHADFVADFVPDRGPLPAPPGAGVTYVSEMPFVSVDAKDEYGPVARNTEIGDAASHVRQPITVAGTVYEKGIGVNSPTSITINLDAKCTRFDAVAGIDATMDQAGKSPNVIFSLSGDGEEIFNSGEVTGGDTPGEAVPVSVDVSGVKLLTLTVDPNGSEWFDRADWADARVTCGGDIAAPAPPGEGTTQLSHLPFVEADAADPQEFGPIARDTAITDMPTRVTPPLTIGGKEYAYGLGVQAPTSMSFNLGGACTRFSAQVGIDATMDQEGKSPSVTFSVLGDGEELWRTEEITGGAAIPASVDVSGVQTLTLVADPGEVNWFDRADWADAKVTCESQDGSDGGEGDDAGGSDDVGDDTATGDEGASGSDDVGDDTATDTSAGEESSNETTDADTSGAGTTEGDTNADGETGDDDSGSGQDGLDNATAGATGSETQADNAAEGDESSAESGSDAKADVGGGPGEDVSSDADSAGTGAEGQVATAGTNDGEPGSTESTATESGSSAASSEESTSGPAEEPSQAGTKPSQNGTRSSQAGSEEALPSTGSPAAALTFGALVLLSAGLVLRRRKVAAAR